MDSNINGKLQFINKVLFILNGTNVTEENNTEKDLIEIRAIAAVPAIKEIGEEYFDNFSYSFVNDESEKVVKSLQKLLWILNFKIDQVLQMVGIMKFLIFKQKICYSFNLTYALKSIFQKLFMAIT